MSISYPLTPPTTPAYVNCEMSLVVQSSASRSQFTGQMKSQNWSRWWEASLQLPVMTNAEARPWIAFLASLDGHAGYFWFSDPDYPGARGVATGTPLMKGSATARSRTITTDGWTASTTGIMKAGDYIQIGNYLYMVLEDADSDGSGDATLEITPELRSDVANNAPIITSNPKGLFMLSSPTSSWVTGIEEYYQISFVIREYLI